MRRSAAVSISLAMGLVVGLAGCGLVGKGSPKLELPRINLVAVLPIERAPESPQPRAVTVEVASEPLAPDAQRVVTAQIYGVMAASPEWRFVPDLVVDQALRDVAPDTSLTQRALLLGKAVGADGVIYGTVSRYRERRGTELGARHPASVSFRLALLSVATEKTVWQESFDQTQQALSSNLFDWWMFWRAGPHWFSAEELTHLGVEKLLDNLRQRLD